MALCAAVFGGAIDASKPGVILDACDDPATWSGMLTRETKNVRSGTVSLRWLFDVSGQVSLSGFPANWGELGNALALWIFVPKTTDYRPQLRVFGRTPEGIESQAYADIRLEMPGWRRLVIPFSEFRSRSDVPMPDWQHVTSIVLHGDLQRWRVGFAPAEMELLLDDVRLVTVTTPLPGEAPRLSDAEFFTGLHLDLPELETVRDAVQSGDLSAARAAFAAHIRSRRDPRWFEMWWERPAVDQKYAAWQVKRAEAYLRREFRMSNVTYKPEGRIDWTHTFHSGGDKATHEYNAALNRFYHFRYMQGAYWQAGRDEMVPEMVRQMVEWAEDNPVLLFADGNGPYHHAWETLNVAVRLGVYWPDVIYRTLNHPSYTDDAIVTIWKSMVEHVEHLMAFPSRNNWLTSESKAVALMGIMNPGFKRAETWGQTGIERLYGQLEEEVYPDGVQSELALGYFVGVLDRFGQILEFAAINNRMDAVPADFRAKLERMYDYFLYSMMPNGKCPGRNDSHVQVDPAARLKDAARFFPERQDFRWAAGESKDGPAPPAASRAFPYAGYYALRTGWDEKRDLFMFFDAGPWGTGHQHEDKLGFTVYAFGQMIVTEAGTHQYNKSAQRAYVLSTRGHNTIRVDGGDQRRRCMPQTWGLKMPFEPLLNPWFTSPELDFVEGTYEHGWGGARQFVAGKHRRSIVFVKPHKLWIVLDTVTFEDEDPHQCQSILHLEAGSAGIVETAVHAVGTQADTRLLFASSGDFALRTVVGQEEPEFQGWTEHRFEKLRPIPTVLVEWKASGSSEVVTVLCPTPHGKPTPVAGLKLMPRAEVSGQGTAVELALTDGKRLLCLLRDPGTAALSVRGHTTGGRCTVVELNGEGQAVRQWQAGVDPHEHSVP